MRTMGWAYADLVRESGESRSVVSQWLGRSSKLIKTIGKMQAAERLEAATGYSALWIAKGLGPKRASEQPAANRLPHDPIANALDVLQAALQAMPTSEREAAATNLAGWARDGGSGRWRAAVAAVLTPHESGEDWQQTRSAGRSAAAA